MPGTPKSRQTEEIKVDVPIKTLSDQELASLLLEYQRKLPLQQAAMCAMLEMTRGHLHAVAKGKHGFSQSTYRRCVAVAEIISSMIADLQLPVPIEKWETPRSHDRARRNLYKVRTAFEETTQNEPITAEHTPTYNPMDKIKV